MSRLYRLSRHAFDFKILHHGPGKLPFFSNFSTFATEQAPAAAPEPYLVPPVGVVLTKKYGRTMVASERLKAGQLLHIAKPILTHPTLSMINCVCYYCLRRLPKRDASVEAPPVVSFCSEDCQEKSKKFYEVEKEVDWTKFHGYCRQQGLKYPLLVKRLACQIIAQNIPADIFIFLQKENLADRAYLIEEEYTLLRSTLEDAVIKVEKKKKEDEEKEPNIDGKTDEGEELLSFLTKEWYMDVLGRIRLNAFRIELPVQSHEDLLSAAAATVEGEAAVGNAVYMLPSFYNHSCDPNVNILWTDTAEGKLVALRDIEQDEEMRISYLDASLGYEARQKILSQGYGFICDCPRCVSKE